MTDKLQEYRGMTVVVRFDSGKCIHSRNCVLGHPGVFAPNVDGPWIRPDEAPAGDIVHIVTSCPSGALTFERLDGGAEEAPPRVNTLHLRENGPLALHADATVDGQPALRATLCRCGASKNKPYCDGSHVEAGFLASGEAAGKVSPALTEAAGKLAVTSLLDGPLHAGGPMEICTGTGHVVERTTQAWLCRCGSSKNKPYCDGTHKKIGFRAEGEAPTRK